MADDQDKELSPAFAGSSLEKMTLVPDEAEDEVADLPPNPPSGFAEVKGLDDDEEEEVWPSVEDSVQQEGVESDGSESDILVEVEAIENDKSESKIVPFAAHWKRPREAAAAAEALPWPEEEEIYGLLHLYKTSGMAMVKERVMQSSMVGILNIPARFTRSRLHNFLAPFQEGIEEVKIIKDASPSRYMALIKFNAQDIADTFYAVYNGCSFNQRDSKVCHLVYVRRMEVLTAEDKASFTMRGLIELPRCSVCLERTGESMKSILTWICDQSFEGQSHQSQDETMCPVCSYFHIPRKGEPRCLECGVRDSLRICLICGLIGCGQDVRGHAEKHFSNTQHAYGMQLNNYQVWDYVKNNYVQSGGASHSNVEQHWREDSEEKINTIKLEFTHLLTNHLESQRIFWEQKIFQLEKETSEEINSMKAKLESTMEKCDKLEYKVSDLLKEKEAVDQKCTHLYAQVTKLFTKLKEEQEISKSLRANQILLQKQLKEEKVLKESCDQTEVQITEIQEQLQDVMFFLEPQKKVSNVPAETEQDIQEEQMNLAMAASASPPPGDRTVNLPSKKGHGKNDK